ncbi:MAG: hypothetical protein AAFO79_08635 [Pseudomonadota bacterium]
MYRSAKLLFVLLTLAVWLTVTSVDSARGQRGELHISRGHLPPEGLRVYNRPIFDAVVFVDRSGDRDTAWFATPELHVSMEFPEILCPLERCQVQHIFRTIKAAFNKLDNYQATRFLALDNAFAVAAPPTVFTLTAAHWQSLQRPGAVRHVTFARDVCLNDALCESAAPMYRVQLVAYVGRHLNNANNPPEIVYERFPNQTSLPPGVNPNRMFGRTARYLHLMVYAERLSRGAEVRGWSTQRWERVTGFKAYQLARLLGVHLIGQRLSLPDYEDLGMGRGK